MSGIARMLPARTPPVQGPYATGLCRDSQFQEAIDSGRILGRCSPLSRRGSRQKLSFSQLFPPHQILHCDGERRDHRKLSFYQLFSLDRPYSSGRRNLVL